MRRFADARDFVGDFLAGAEAGIKQAHFLKPVQRRAIGGAAGRLAQHRLFPGKSKPAQILEDRRHEFLAAACRIDVLDAQQKTRPRSRRRDGREGMAQMQEARWTWRETRDSHGARLHDPVRMIIRSATPADAFAVASVRMTSWRATYRGREIWELAYRPLSDLTAKR